MVYFFSSSVTLWPHNDRGGQSGSSLSAGQTPTTMLSGKLWLCWINRFLIIGWDAETWDGGIGLTLTARGCLIRDLSRCFACFGNKRLPVPLLCPEMGLKKPSLFKCNLVQNLLDQIVLWDSWDVRIVTTKDTRWTVVLWMQSKGKRDEYQYQYFFAVGWKKEDRRKKFNHLLPQSQWAKWDHWLTMHVTWSVQL